MLLISGALFAGFGLGLLASGSALLTGFNLGKIILPYDNEPLPPATIPTLTRRSTVSDHRMAAPGQIENKVPVQAATLRGPPAKIAGDAAVAAEVGDNDRRSASAPRFASATKRRTENAPVAAPARETSELADTGAAEPGSVTRSWETLYARGHRAQSAGDLPAATRWYQQAARLNPNHPAIRYDLGYVLQLSGKSADAIDQYRMVIRLNANHAHAHYNLGYLLQQRGDDDQAEKVYEKAAALDPDNAYIYHNWAVIRESRGDLAGAKELYRKAVALDPRGRPGSDAWRRLAALNAGRRVE